MNIKKVGINFIMFSKYCIKKKMRKKKVLIPYQWILLFIHLLISSPVAPYINIKLKTAIKI